MNPNNSSGMVPQLDMTGLSMLPSFWIFGDTQEVLGVEEWWINGNGLSWSWYRRDLIIPSSSWVNTVVGSSPGISQLGTYLNRGFAETMKSWIAHKIWEGKAPVGGVAQRGQHTRWQLLLLLPRQVFSAYQCQGAGPLHQSASSVGATTKCLQNGLFIPE